MVDKHRLAVYNCKQCGFMVIGLDGPTASHGKSCPRCYGQFEKNNVATTMMERNDDDE